MRLASYELNGTPSYGIVTSRGVHDLGRRFGHRYATLTQFLGSPLARTSFEQLQRPPDAALDELRFLPVVPDAGAFFCVGLNYADHARESGRPLPAQPSTFLKLNRSLVGHGQALRLPRVSQMFDWEAELAVVIGCHARHVAEADALACVAGYTCVNDGSIRDWQLQRDVTQGKNFLASGAIGPWLVTPEEIPDPGDLVVISRLNGIQMQRASTSNLIFSEPRLVAYYSTITELRPGDVISTGTPAGVGHRRDPQIFMRPGDVIEVEISGIGVLRNTVEAEQ